MTRLRRPGMPAALRILFAHANFPAQFGAFGAWLAARGWDVTFAMAAETHRHARSLASATVARGFRSYPPDAM